MHLSEYPSRDLLLELNRRLENGVGGNDLKVINERLWRIEWLLCESHLTLEDRTALTRVREQSQKLADAVSALTENHHVQSI